MLGGTTAKAEAVGWLRDILKGGDSMDGKQLKKLASDSGIKERTLYRAAQAIGVKMLPGGFAKPFNSLLTILGSVSASGRQSETSETMIKKIKRVLSTGAEGASADAV